MSTGLVLSVGVFWAVLGAATCLLWLDRRSGTTFAVMLVGAVVVGSTTFGLAYGAEVLVNRGVIAEATSDITVWSRVGAASGVGMLVCFALLALFSRLDSLDGPFEATTAALVFGAAAGVVGTATSWRPLALRPPGEALVIVLATMLASAVVGLGVGLATLKATRGQQVLFVAPALALATALEVTARAGATGEWLARPELARAALATVACLAALAILVASLRVERRVLANELREEVVTRVLPAWVLDTVPHFARRIRTRWWPRRDERRVVIALLTTLAFRKRRLRSLDEDQARVFGLEVGRLRQRVRMLLAVDEDELPVDV
jgi:hypothetical protein